MFSFTEQFSAASKSQFETQLKIINAFASKTFEGAQQVIALNLSATKATVDKSSAAAKKLLEAKDPQEFFTLSATQAPNLEQVLAYSRELFSIASKTQAELVQSAREQIKEVTAAATSIKPLTLVPPSTLFAAPAAPAAAAAPALAAVAGPAVAAPVSAPLAAAPAAPADVVSAPAAAPKAAAKAEAKAKPATPAKAVAEAVGKAADKPAAAPIAESKPVVLKSVVPQPGAKPLEVQASKAKK